MSRARPHRSQRSARYGEWITEGDFQRAWQIVSCLNVADKLPRNPLSYVASELASDVLLCA